MGNAVEANLWGCVAPAEQASGRVFNVGCGRRISINELWRRIRDATGASVEPRHDPSRAGDVRDSLASIDAAREALGYESRAARGGHSPHRSVVFATERVDRGIAARRRNGLMPDEVGMNGRNGSMRWAAVLLMACEPRSGFSVAQTLTTGVIPGHVETAAG